MSAADRRAAYRWIAATLRDYPPSPNLTRPSVCAEIERIRAQLEAAGAVVDELGEAKAVTEVTTADGGQPF